MPNTQVYCCGPPPITGSRPFEIELRRSATVVQVPADRTALDVIRDAVPSVP